MTTRRSGITVRSCHSSIPWAVGRFVTPKRLPAVFHGTPSAIGAPAPLLGTDSEELLAEFGYTEAEIVRMQSDGLV